MSAQLLHVHPLRTHPRLLFDTGMARTEPAMNDIFHGAMTSSSSVAAAAAAATSFSASKRRSSSGESAENNDAAENLLVASAAKRARAAPGLLHSDEG